MRAADEHRTAYLTGQVVEAGNDVQAALIRLQVVPEETPAGIIDYCARAVATSRALCRLTDATLAVTQEVLSDLEEATRA